MLPYEPITCPKCGAQSWEETYRCWLCQRTSALAPRVASDPPAPASIASPAKTLAPAAAPHVVREPVRRVFSFSLSTLLLYMTAIAVGVGLTMQHPALGVLYGFFILPPMIVTTLFGVRRRLRGKSNTPAQRVGRFLINVAILIGVIVALTLAIGVAFFLICTINPPNFQHAP